MTPPPYSPVGETREKIFQYVRQELLEGRSPTLREIRDAFGFSALESIRQHLAILVEEGRLAKRGGQARGYSLPESQRPRQTVEIPMIGRITAGGLREAVENHEDSIPISLEDISPDDLDSLFALRVEGESMVGAGILPGDVVVVRSLGDRGTGARTGDIVVAMIGDAFEVEATVKTLRRSGSTIELWPENPEYEPLFLAPNRVRLLGVVREVRRFLRPQSRRRAAPWQKGGK